MRSWGPWWWRDPLLELLSELLFGRRERPFVVPVVDHAANRARLHQLLEDGAFADAAGFELAALLDKSATHRTADDVVALDALARALAGVTPPDLARAWTGVRRECEEMRRALATMPRRAYARAEGLFLVRVEGLWEETRAFFARPDARSRPGV